MVIGTTEQKLSPLPTTRDTRVSIVDEAILTGMAMPGRLFCTLDSGFISLAVADAERNKFYGFEVFPFPKPPGDAQLVQAIKNLSSESVLLRKVDFRSVSVQVSNTAFTFIPQALFRNEDASGYYTFNHPERQDEIILSDEIRSVGVVSIFAMTASLMNALKHLFENFTVHHHLTSLIESVRYASQDTTGRSLYVHLHASLMDVVVMEERKLILANSYSYKSAEDAVYFLLMVTNQLALNPEKTNLVLTGEVDSGSGIPDQLATYFRHLEFGQRTKATAFSYGFDALPPHYYHLPFSHILCAS